MALVKIGPFKVFIKTAYRYSHDRNINYYFAKIKNDWQNWTVLNIGEGNTGTYAHYFKNTNYETLDIDPATCPSYCMDITKRTPTKKYDLIVSFNLLEHISEPIVYFENIKRMLKPNGIFYGSVPFMYPIHDKHDFYRYTQKGLLYTLQKHFTYGYVWPFGNPIITLLRSLASIKYIGIFFNLTSRFWELLFNYTDPKSPSGYFMIIQKKE